MSKETSTQRWKRRQRIKHAKPLTEDLLSYDDMDAIYAKMAVTVSGEVAYGFPLDDGELYDDSP